MATLFTKIINGEIPSYKIAEDDQNYAFLDINPLAKGHTLCVPKLEQDYLFDLPADRLASLSTFSQRVAKALKAATGCSRVGVAVLGFDVPHAHIHLVPMDNESTLNFKNERVKLSEAEFKQIAQNVAAKFQ